MGVTYEHRRVVRRRQELHRAIAMADQCPVVDTCTATRTKPIPYYGGSPLNVLSADTGICLPLCLQTV